MRDFNQMNADQLGRIYRTDRKNLSETELDQLVNAIANRAQEEHVRFTGLVKKRAPKGYLTLRDAEEILARGMWGCSPCPAHIVEIRRKAKREMKGRSLASGPRLARAATTLTKAFHATKLTLCATVDETRSDPRFTPVPDWAKVPIPVPMTLLGHVFVKGNNRTNRRMPATFAIRPSRKAVADDRLFVLLNSGCALLVVRETEFWPWYRAERRKRKWASQRRQARVRLGVGRPRKQEARLQNAILGIALAGAWDGRRHPLTALHRTLAESGNDPPSLDTLGRRLDELFVEKGEPALCRRHRVRRK